MTTKITGIKHIFPLFGTTDFCHLTRKYILKMIEYGVPTTIDSVGLESNLIYSSVDQKLFKCLGNKIDYNVVVNWLHPLNSSKLYRAEQNKQALKVSFSDEEADTLYTPWSLLLNTNVDLAFVPSNMTKQKYNNISKPVHISYYPVDITDFLGVENNIKVATDRPVNPTPSYTFYSNIFFDNKYNLEILLHSYYSAFLSSDPVCLVLGVTIPTNQPADFNQFKTILKDISKAYKKKLPNILVIFDPTVLQKIALHKLCNCYVNVAKTSSFNLDCIRASLNKNGLVTHEYDDHLEYKIDENVKIYDSELVTPNTGELINYNDELKVIKPNADSISKLLKESFNTTFMKNSDKSKLDLPIQFEYNSVITNFLSIIDSSL
jgi:hypothetical protein